MDNDHSSEYSEEGLWEKLKRYARAAGIPVVEKVLQLFYALQSPETPKWAKGVIIAALGYFISPVDAVPDIIPVVGFSDDLVVLTAAIATVHLYITDEIKRLARAKTEEWFGKLDLSEGDLA